MESSKEDEDVQLEESEEMFINPADVIEVEVDDDIPMEDDDEDDDEDDNENDEEKGSNKTADKQRQENEMNSTSIAPDISIATITSHKPSPVYAIAAHHDGESLSFVSGGGDDKAFLHILSSDTKSTNTIPLEHKHTDSVSCVAINIKYANLTKTPNYIAVGSYDGTIILYDPKHGHKIHVLDGPTDVEFLSFHPKGGSVLLAGSIADATVWMYHIPTAKCLQVFVGHECNSEGGGVTTGSFTPDGKFAVTAGMDGTLRVWAPRTGLCKHVFKLSTTASDGTGGRGLTCLSINGGQEGQLVICGGEDGNAYVVHIQGKKIVATLQHFDAVVNSNLGSGGGHGMEVDDEEDIIVTSVEAVGFATKEVNSNWVATGGSDGVMKVWDLTHGVGQCRQICKLSSEHDLCGGIIHLNWHPTMPLILVSYADGIVRLWDARDGTLLYSLSGGSSTTENQINDFAAEFVGVENGAGGTAHIATANDDGTIKVYNVDVQSVLMEATQVHVP